MPKKYLPEKNYVGAIVPIYQQPISRFEYEGIAVVKRIIENDVNNACVRAMVHFKTDQEGIYFERLINKKDLEGKGE